MLRITERAPAGATAVDSLSLPFELRRRSRLRTRLESGAEAALFLPRGWVLKDGDLLRAEDGAVIRVRAAPETVSRARTADAHLLARAAYHLGNRHVALQVGPGELRYPRDHVLDDMLRSLGLTVTAEQLPFEPEAGAYGGQGHDHPHGHEDSHDPGHGHPDEHDHGEHGPTHPAPGHGHEH
jgi:urease accessory protein